MTLLRRLIQTNMPSGIYTRKYKKSPEELKHSRQLLWKRYYKKHKDRLAKNNKLRRLENKQYYKQYEKDRYAKDPGFYKTKHKNYSRTNRETVNKYIRNKYENNLQFKLKCILRARLRSALKNNQKFGKTLDLIGCSIPDLKIHIEKNFKSGMSWNNWKYKGWHIDHVIPISLFDLSKAEEVLKACHFTNLQPMWSLENHKKGNRLDTDTGTEV